jgi:Uncharacterised nucleotidyltransferase
VAGPTEHTPAWLWEGLDRLLDGATLAGILDHGLGPLAAERARRLDLEVDPVLAREDRSARLTAATALQLIRRIRESCDGPLVLFKGLELARRYPGGARRFADIDLLTPQAEAVQESLLAAGFVVNAHGQIPSDFHLRPLVWPGIPLEIEIHADVFWSTFRQPPAPAEIVEAAVPTRIGVDGVVAPAPAHHALILAAHSCEERALRSIRDLLDVALVAAEVQEEELERLAAAWRGERLWRTVQATTGALFGERRTIPLLTWARHLPAVREPTVLESHLERLMSAYWCMPARDAFPEMLTAIRAEVMPLPGESWRTKMARSFSAVRHSSMARSSRDSSNGGRPR